MIAFDLTFARQCSNTLPIIDSTTDMDALLANKHFASIAMASRTMILAMVRFDCSLVNATGLSPTWCDAVWTEPIEARPYIDATVVGDYVRHRVVWPGYGHTVSSVYMDGVLVAPRFDAAFAMEGTHGNPVYIDVDSSNSVIVTARAGVYAFNSVMLAVL